jgi:hypothetical protein
VTASRRSTVSALTLPHALVSSGFLKLESST